MNNHHALIQLDLPPVFSINKYNVGLPKLADLFV